MKLSTWYWEEDLNLKSIYNTWKQRSIIYEWDRFSFRHANMAHWKELPLLHCFLRNECWMGVRSECIPSLKVIHATALHYTMWFHGKSKSEHPARVDLGWCRPFDPIHTHDMNLGFAYASVGLCDMTKISGRRSDLQSAANNQVHSNMASRPHELWFMCVMIVEAVNFHITVHVVRAATQPVWAISWQCGQRHACKPQQFSKIAITHMQCYWYYLGISSA